MTIASALDDEFSKPDGPADGWHVFASARKPGAINPFLTTPEPWCPDCHSRSLETSLLECRCTACSREYLTRFGIPYLLRDRSAAYSPKRDRPQHLALDRQIDTVLRESYAKLRRAAPDGRVQLLGIGPATAFAVRHLRQHGMTVAAAGASEERLIGKAIEGVPIVPVGELARGRPLLLAGDNPMDVAAFDALLHRRHAGLAISLLGGAP